MKNICLDTDRYRDLCDGVPAVIACLERATEIAVPFVVVAELRAGFAVGTKGRSNEQVLQQFLRKPGVNILWPTTATFHCYASVYRHLRFQGTPIPTNDLWIAALTIEHSLALLTRDAHFQHLPQISIIALK